MSLILNKDAFSSGQVSSKLWLCRELERIAFTIPPVIWLLGGWYGITSLLLFSRNNMFIKHIRSFDIDPTAEPIADMINENWVWQKWKFKAFTHDCNSLNFKEITDFGEIPDIIINTSSEHFKSSEWYENIPRNKLIVIQSTDLKHEDHVFSVSNHNELAALFPMTQLLYAGEKHFDYGQNNAYSRFMIIGYK
jgi:hypothetical protein